MPLTDKPFCNWNRRTALAVRVPIMPSGVPTLKPSFDNMVCALDTNALPERLGAAFGWGLTGRFEATCHLASLIATKLPDLFGRFGAQLAITRSADLRSDLDK